MRSFIIASVILVAVVIGVFIFTDHIDSCISDISDRCDEIIETGSAHPIDHIVFRWRSLKNIVSLTVNASFVERANEAAVSLEFASGDDGIFIYRLTVFRDALKAIAEFNRISFNSIF